MKYTTLALKSWILFFWLPVSAYAQSGSDPVSYVNALMGTASNETKEHGVISNGYVYPVISLPFGMYNWTAQTGTNDDPWIYSYNDNYVYGLRQTNSPSPWMGDYGSFSIMPITGTPRFRDEERASWFSHKSEQVHPYYYSVYLVDHDVTAEITPTETCAALRFTFPSADSAYLVIDAMEEGSYIKIDPDAQTISGYSTKNSGAVPDNFKNHFIIRFNQPFSSTAVWQDGELQENSLEFSGDHAGAVVGFRPTDEGKVEATVASSYISKEQAQFNFREVENESFESVRELARQAWNAELSRVAIEGATDRQLRTFYSCLYRMLIYPRRFYETNPQGEIVHYSPYTGEVLPGYLFVDTGFWDTFRAQFPFFNLMYPSLSAKIMAGLVNAYQESGWLPEWASPGHQYSMIGSHSASVIADAYLKGVRGYDIETLYEGILKNSENNGPRNTGREGVNYYNRLGYVPYDVGISQNGSRTLEYAYDDFTIYQLAQALGRPQEENDRFARRSQNYRNIFDSTTSLMRGRNQDGTFQSPFDPFRWGVAFTEGNSWHYTWSVMHDAQGLSDLMGGTENFISMIDSVFMLSPLHYDVSHYNRGTIHLVREMQQINMGQYAHGNEPMQHLPYLYNFGAPWKAQYRLREIMDRLYAPTPDGFAGDDDNGQTSAWYFFSSLGFYPLCPGTDQYVIGTPLFPKAVLTLENGNKITINAPKVIEDNRYIDQVMVNGKLHTKNWFSHNHLMKGCTINFSMSAVPNQGRGTEQETFPYSYSDQDNNSQP